jgi:DNA polymerase-1
MDLSVLPMLARIESVGMQVDGEALRRIGAQLHLEYVRVCGRLEAILGYPLNPKAAEDVSETLFDELSVTPTKLTKSGKHYTTGDKFLEARRKEHAVIPLIIEGRELWKLKSSYADKLPGMLDAQGRYHPEFSYTRTASGRLAETIILLIPKHSAWGKKIRCAFVAGVDHSLVSVDLSQIELRVLAHESRDEALIQVFREGRDPHAETAHSVFGAPKRKEDQDESKHRLPAKKGNFGAFMGLSPMGLTEQVRAGGNPEWARGCLACDYTDANPRERPEHDKTCASVVFFREYFKLYKGVRQYIDDRHAEARRHGFVRDMWGRKIYVPGIYSASQGVVRRFERMAQATPIQSGADGISKHWNAAIWREMIVRHQQKRKGWYLEPWGRTHDDTVAEVDSRFAEVTKARMLKLVPQVLCIPVGAEGKIGSNWGSLK